METVMTTNQHQQQTAPVVEIFRLVTAAGELIAPVIFDPHASIGGSYNSFTLLAGVFATALLRVEQLDNVSDADRQYARDGLQDLAENLQTHFRKLMAKRGVRV
jgi:hypothetical protein